MKALYRHRRRMFPVAAMAVTVCGCTAKPLDCVYPDSTSVIPILAFIAYPESGETGVPIDIGSVLYYSGSSPLLIVRVAGKTVNLTTLPTSVPSPLPSPIASPPYVGATLAAIGVPTLTPDTSYDVGYEATFASGCSTTTTDFVAVGSFTTQ